ncbi:hypothetical protein MesoLjLc_05590 [Mesorhizobium sp. L-8-10]|uniref:hypothetical protein n=1 Tax=unclassified Mesorhizobium TaxID=325217 RepID=UPI0019278F8D|nr:MULTISPECIES: hypothetical protein [unclassified Mesorhizobium]BCH20801.1 hypothetical protein MesoLjLb_05860 [Mesorhizobium sp. L-8-3]BCH28629.1 hypothetical protein MesoLjLc_05590 [Mesorhizobium sp. L-8-10]
MVRHHFIGVDVETGMGGPVLLGTTASAFASLPDAMAAMTGGPHMFQPAVDTAAIHSRRLAAFEALQQTARAIRNIDSPET